MNGSELGILDFAIITGAAVLAGLVNAIAGGGTLISFPALTLVGVPALAANITNSVALCPGYLGAAFAQRDDLKGQGTRLFYSLTAGVVGSALGAWLLMASGERIFRQLVPGLILLACALLAAQDWLKGQLLARRKRRPHKVHSEAWVAAPIAVAAVYGGYFGAGMSVMVLALLGVAVDDNLTRLNALKQVIGLTVNVTAAIVFLFSGEVVWPAAIAMAAGSLAGGAIGGRLAGRLSPIALRRAVIGAGLVLAVVFAAR